MNDVEASDLDYQYEGELDLDALEAWAKTGVEFGDGPKLVTLTEDTLLALIRRTRKAEEEVGTWFNKHCQLISDIRRKADLYDDEAKDTEELLTEVADMEALLLRNFAKGLRNLVHPVEEPTALAWTPDDEMEAGVQRFKEHFPKQWEAWVAWCRAEDEKYGIKRD